MRWNIARALVAAAIPVPGGYANDLAELEALSTVWAIVFSGETFGNDDRTFRQ